MLDDSSLITRWAEEFQSGNIGKSHTHSHSLEDDVPKVLVEWASAMAYCYRIPLGPHQCMDFAKYKYQVRYMMERAKTMRKEMGEDLKKNCVRNAFTRKKKKEVGDLLTYQGERGLKRKTPLSLCTRVLNACLHFFFFFFA